MLQMKVLQAPVTDSYYTENFYYIEYHFLTFIRVILGRIFTLADAFVCSWANSSFPFLPLTYLPSAYEPTFNLSESKVDITV